MISNASRCLLWMDESRSACMNMAVDELLLEHAPEAGAPVLRFYGWNEPSASFGYSQPISAVTRTGLTLVRRPTGGGVVYHDCDLTYTLAIPPGHPICGLDRMESYRAIHEPIMRAILRLGKGAHLAPDLGEKHDRATLQCFVSPSPNDVIASDGVKLAGAAQRRTRNGILHQGSVSLKASPGGGRDSIIQAIRNAFAEELSFVYEPFAVPDSLLRSAEELAVRKYATEAWNVDKVAPC